MMKRFLTLLLCLLMLLPCLAGCANTSRLNADGEEDKGAIITMYLSEMVYDLDPARAYNNEAALKVVSLLFEPLFTLTEKGKVEKNLVESYEIIENEDAAEYKLRLNLKESYWSDSTYLSAEDVVFAWKRILDVEASFDAACLLYDIKNARAVREGDQSIDNLGLAADNLMVEVTFETYYKTSTGRLVTKSDLESGRDALAEGETLGDVVKVDYNQFLRNLTSVALAPLREDITTKTSFYKVGEERFDKNNDWAKRSTTMSSSGAFKLRTTDYSDVPARDNNGNYVLDENGEYLYQVYTTNYADGKKAALKPGSTYFVDEAENKTYLITAMDLTELDKNNKDLAAEIRSKMKTATDADCYTKEPQVLAQIVLERNAYYMKKANKDNWKMDDAVIPYRLVIDYTLSDEEIMQKFKAGEIYYVGDIPLSVRENYVSEAEVSDALSTHTYYLNQNAVIPYNYIELDAAGLPVLFDKEGLAYTFDAKTGAAVFKNAADKAKYKEEFDENGNRIYYTADKTVISSNKGVPNIGEKLLENENLRLALSAAIDRTAIAKAIVLADAATALVPTGIYEGSKANKFFRDTVSGYLTATAETQKAKDYLTASGIDFSKFTLSLSYADYDPVHALIAETVAAAWTEVGIPVKLDPLMPIFNEDLWSTTEEKLDGVNDDLWLEALVAGNYQIMAIDLVSKSTDAFGILAPFAKAFSGMGMDMTSFDEAGNPIYNIAPHQTGFDDETYNEMIEKAFAEKNTDARAALLHDAEAYLMEKMPVIPIVYNKNAYLVNDKMLTDTEGTYYIPARFTNCYLKGTIQHTAHKNFIFNLVFWISFSVVVVAAAITVAIILKKKAKQREEEIARISAEHEAKLREIRPGQSKK